MSKIFISYSSLDSQQAGEFYSALRRQAHEVWMDRAELKGGQEWLQVIQEQIRWADTMVVIWSANALASTWVQTELQFAHALGKKIIPVGIDDTSSLEHIIVNALQMIDARQHDIQQVIEEIQTAIESDHQPGSNYHQVPLPTPTKSGRFPMRWIVMGGVALLALTLVLSGPLTDLLNATPTILQPTATISVSPSSVPTVIVTPVDHDAPATVALLNTWRNNQGLPPLLANDQLQQVAVSHLSYLRSLPLSELEQTNIFRTADGQDVQFMAQTAGYSGAVNMVVAVTQATVTLADVLADLEDVDQFSEVGFAERRSFSTGNQYFVLILGAPM